MRGSDGGHDLVGIGVLEQVSGRTGLERRVHAIVLAERRQGDDLDTRVARANASCRLDPVDRCHLQVHQDDVREAFGIGCFEHVECVWPVRRLADELEVRFACQKAREAAAHDCVIVDDEHADRAGGHALPLTTVSPEGTSTWTHVPPPTWLEISAVPPSSDARPRIDSRP